MEDQVNDENEPVNRVRRAHFIFAPGATSHVLKRALKKFVIECVLLAGRHLSGRSPEAFATFHASGIAFTGRPKLRYASSTNGHFHCEDGFKMDLKTGYSESSPKVFENQLNWVY